jgi:hypothetical protein
MSRNIFVKTYLRDEMRMYRWIQFTVQEAKRKGMDTDSGYHYRSETSELFVEYHVDVNECSQKIGNCMRFGGNLSVRFPPYQKILLSFGHDEVIFNKNSFSKKCWFGQQGEQPLVPKEDGTGAMISAMQSREFGFGFPELTNDQLLSINSIRMAKEYSDVNAAIKGFGYKSEAIIQDRGLPFCALFQFWNKQRRILELRASSHSNGRLY